MNRDILDRLVRLQESSLLIDRLKSLTKNFEGKIRSPYLIDYQCQLIVLVRDKTVRDYFLLDCKPTNLCQPKVGYRAD